MAKAGKFEVKDDGSVIGPADYMKSDQYETTIKKIEQGQSTIVNFSLAQGNTIPTAIVVALQTDYAAWKGMQSLLNRNRH